MNITALMGAFSSLQLCVQCLLSSFSCLCFVYRDKLTTKSSSSCVNTNSASEVTPCLTNSDLQTHTDNMLIHTVYDVEQMVVIIETLTHKSTSLDNYIYMFVCFHVAPCALCVPGSD